MLQAVFRNLRMLLFCMATCLALPVFAQEQTTLDSLFTDTTSLQDIDERSEPIDGEYIEPEVEHPVVYNSSAPTDAQWQQATGDGAYSYQDKQEYEIKKKEPAKGEPAIIRFLRLFFDFFTSPLGKAILWIVLLSIVGYIAYRLISGQGSGIFGRNEQLDDGGQDAELSEQGLLENDWEALLQTALQSGDGRMAVRYSYLRLLQILQEQDLIIYRPDKTNMDYYRELADNPQRQSFRSMARQYEFAWYGNFIPGAQALDSYMKMFGQLKQSLGTS